MGGHSRTASTVSRVAIHVSLKTAFKIFPPASLPIEADGGGLEQDLDGDVALQTATARAVDLPHPAGAELTDYLIRTETRRQFAHQIIRSSAGDADMGRRSAGPPAHQVTRRTLRCVHAPPAHTH